MTPSLSPHASLGATWQVQVASRAHQGSKRAQLPRDAHLLPRLRLVHPPSPLPLATWLPLPHHCPWPRGCRCTHVINEYISVYNPAYCTGILDIFGFENFDCNSFPQVRDLPKSRQISGDLPLPRPSLSRALHSMFAAVHQLHQRVVTQPLHRARLQARAGGQPIIPLPPAASASTPCSLQPAA